MTMSATQAEGDAASLPGVRGTLYESPTYGWSLVVEPGPWTIEGATTDGVIDAISLVAADTTIATARLALRSAPGTVDDIPARLDQAQRELVTTDPGATIAPAPLDSGTAVPQELETGHWIASFFVTNSATGQVTIVDIDAWAIRNAGAVVTVVMSSAAQEYEASRWAADELLARYSDPRATRTGMSRAERLLTGRVEDAVLEFRPLNNRPLHFTLTTDQVEAMKVEYHPPSITVPDGKTLILATGMVQNVDTGPSLLDLGAMVGRFPVEDNVPGEAAYRPIDHAWLYGGPTDQGRSTQLRPGEAVAWLAWYLVDLLPANQAGTQSIDISYEPGGTRLADCGYSSRIGYRYPIAGGGGGGSRPRVQY